VANTGKDASGGTIYLWLPFSETGADNSNAYGFGSIVGFNRNAAKQVPLLDTSTAANNRPFPTVVLAGDGLAPLDLNAGDATATTRRVVLAAVAHDAVDTGNPVKIGARAISSVLAGTLVASGDRTDLEADLDGSLIVRNETSLADLKSDRVADTGGTSTAFTNLNAGGAGVRNYVTCINIYNSSTTNGFVDIRDGTGGSVIWTLPAPAQSGCIVPFPKPLRQPTANTALAYDVSAAISTVYISVAGFQSKCG